MDIIKATNVHRKFGTGDLEAHILKGIDVTVKQGEFVAIMGKSGAGKSTLMYQLSVLDDPTDGTIIINGTDVGTLSESEIETLKDNIFYHYFMINEHFNWNMIPINQR